MEQSRLKIVGKVQGVSFRAMACEMALSLGLNGYAKNMPDGSVELLLQGKEEAMKSFISWAKEGSRYAVVKDIQTQIEKADESFTGFKIL
jgi:acylphosphatase